MKTASKRLLSLALVLCMILSFSGAAFAEDEAKKPVYTVLGDSNAVACGLDSYYTDPDRDWYAHEGSYAQIVGDALCAETIQDAHVGWRTVEFLRCVNYALDRDYTADEYSDMFLNGLGVYKGRDESMGYKIVEDIQKSDYISIQFGGNDIFNYAFCLDMSDFYALIAKAEAYTDLSGIETLDDLYAVLYSIPELVDDVNAFIQKLLKDVKTGTESYMNNIPQVISLIRELNPTAKIYLIGVNNCMPISATVGESSINLTGSIDVYVAMINSYLEYFCSERGEYTYIDSTNAEVVGFVDSVSLDSGFMKKIHFTANGHQYVANQILTAISGDYPVVTTTVTGTYSAIAKRTVLKWDAVNGAIAYKVYRADSENGKYRLIGTSLNTTYYQSLINVKSGTVYYYKVLPVLKSTALATADYSAPVAICAKAGFKTLTR